MVPVPRTGGDNRRQESPRIHGVTRIHWADRDIPGGGRRFLNTHIEEGSPVRKDTDTQDGMA